jgi:hypothetical protein
MIIPFDIVGAWEKVKNVVNSQESVNWYIENNSEGTVLYPTDGLKKTLDFELKGFGRKLYQYKDKADNRLFAVVGSNVFSLDSLFFQNLVGTIETDEAFVDIDDDGTFFLLVDGSNGWTYNRTNGQFLKITSFNFPSTPNAVTFFGSRFLVSNPSSNLITPSEILDPTTWVISAQFGLPQNEKVVSHETLDGRLFVFGQTITQIWQDVGLPVEPFQKEPTDLNYGCAAAGSIAKEEGVLVWLTQDKEGVGAFVLSEGGLPVNITSPAIAERLSSYDDVSDVRAYIYRNEFGHIFYRVSFTKENESWQFRINDRVNRVEKRWFKLESNSKDRHFVEDHSYFNRKHIGLDYRNNNLYEMSLEYGDDAGTAIRRARVCKEFSLPNLSRVRCGEMMVNVNSGASLDGYKINETLHGSTDSKLYLSISRDGGVHFGNPLAASVGKIGDTTKTVRYTRFGESKKFTFKLETYSRVPLFLLGSRLNVSKGKG